MRRTHHVRVSVWKMMLAQVALWNLGWQTCGARSHLVLGTATTEAKSLLHVLLTFHNG